MFEWLTGEEANPSLAHKSQQSMAVVSDPRVAELQRIYQPKKTTLASLCVVDTPGLSRKHEGNAARLALIREAGCLVIVVAAFDGSDHVDELRSIDEDFLLADLEIVQGRVERLRDSVKKPRPNRDEEIAELAALEPLVEVLEAGRALRELELTPDQTKAIRSFQLFSEKPRLVLVNLADDDSPTRFESSADDLEIVAVPISLQKELAEMDENERQQFCEELGVESYDRDGLLRNIMSVSGQMLFFTAGEKEVRTWMIPVGGTAGEAAGAIHTDLERGFVRAETMNIDDLIRLGSEREVKANNLMRHEHKGYVIQDGDILHILSSV